MKFQRGKNESIEYYRVIGMFRNYHNKWFVYMDRKNFHKKRIPTILGLWQGLYRRIIISLKRLHWINIYSEDLGMCFITVLC